MSSSRAFAVAFLIGSLAAGAAARTPPGQDPCRVFTCDQGGIVRGATTAKRMALIFTGGSFADAMDEGVRQGYGDGYLRKNVAEQPAHARQNTAKPVS